MSARRPPPVILVFAGLLGVDAVAGALWAGYWAGVAVLGSPDASLTGGDLSRRDEGVLLTLFTGLPAAVAAVLAIVLIVATPRRAPWVPAVAAGIHTLLLLALLALRGLPIAIDLARWAAVAGCLTALGLPVTRAGRAWFGRRRGRARVAG